MEGNAEAYHKLIFFTRTELKGTYRFKDQFQIYPIKGDGFPYSEIQEHFPNYLELRITGNDNITIQTPYPEMDGIISRFAPIVIKQDLILSLLTACSNHLFFRYDNTTGSWALPVTSSNPDDYIDSESIWCIPIYGSKKMSENNVIIKFTDLSKFEKIQFINYRDYYMNGIDPDKNYSGPIKFVNIIDAFLISYYNLENEIKLIINQAMYHLKNGVELAESKKSLSLLSLFTALETMVNLEYREFKAEKCEACGQEKFKVSKKFRDFLTKYVANNPSSKAKFNKLYSLRSKIVHTGEILNSEFLFSDSSQDKFNEEKLKIIEVIQFCRLSIVNWITQHQIKKQEDLNPNNLF